LPFPLTNSQRAQGNPYFSNSFRLNDTHTFTPTLINKLSMGYNRVYNKILGVTAYPEVQNWGDKIGGIKNNPYYNTHFPNVTFATDNFYGWNTGQDQVNPFASYEFRDDITWI